MKRFPLIRSLCVGLIALALFLASTSLAPGVAHADGVCDSPDTRLSGETPTYEHTSQDDIVSGALSFEEVFRRGEILFSTTFNECDGKGRPAATGNGTPNERLPETAKVMNRVSALDAGNCAVCHNIPRTGGGGDFATTVFVLAQNLDPQSWSTDGRSGNERASPHLFGAGGVELLAREITADLDAYRNSCLEEAEQTGRDATRTQLTHGVNYGSIRCTPSGAVYTNGQTGVDIDRIVKPFHQKGAARSLREFTINPLNHHHGIQPVERFGYGRTFTTDFDKDGVPTDKEATTGDVSALVAYQAHLAVPGQVLPDDEAGQARVERGYQLFNAIGCAGCHIEEMQTYGSEFSEPYHQNPPGNLNDPSRGFSFNLLTQGELPRFEPVQAGAESGPMKVRLFSDLRRHIICDAQKSYFCNEQVQMGTAPLSAFLTAKLWGVGNTAPYGHRGNIATLSEAILHHGGEATAHSDAFSALAEADKEDLIFFLKSLQILPPGAPRLVMYQSEVDALNQAGGDVVVSGARQAMSLDGLLAGGVPLNGGPLFFLAGLAAYPVLRRRRVWYALPMLLGTLTFSIMLSGVSLAATDSAGTPQVASGAMMQVQQGPPVAKLRAWGINLPDQAEPVYNTLETGVRPAQGKVPLKVTFNNLSYGDPMPTEFTWDFGDGSAPVITTDGRQVSHTYTTPGLYEVTITATSSAGSTTKVYENYVFAQTTTPWFTNVTAESGVISNHAGAVNHQMPFGQGAGWADYNNDGWEDLYVVQNSGRSWLWRNNGDGTFTDKAREARVDNFGGMAMGMAWADFNNDGCQDLIVGNFDHKGATGSSPRTKLYRNNCNGTFTDVARQAGLAADGWRHATHFSWGDYDNDGLLDLYVSTHTSHNNFDPPTADGSTDLLFHQNPDHTFTNVTSMLQPAVNTQGLGFASTWVDFDKDGDQDLYVVYDLYFANNPVPPEKNILWRNTLIENGVPGFTDSCATPAGQEACITLFGMGVAVADYNRDGWMDMSVSNTGPSYMLQGGPNMLFTDVTEEPGVNISRGRYGDTKSVTWGQYAFDYDNNGTSDLIQVSGFLVQYQAETYVQPDALFSNDGTGHFTDVSPLSGLDDPGRGRTGSLADYDRDGDLDWYVGNYNGVGRLFRNDYKTVTGENYNWLRIKLRGNTARRSNRDAIGARVEVTSGGATQTQVLGANVGSGGNTSRILHFGLNTHSVVDSLTITWPSGQVQTLTNVAPNQVLNLIEP